MGARPTVVPLAEAKNKLSELIERVSQGEEFVITRHNAEIARLVSATRPARQDLAGAIAAMRAGRPGRAASLAELLAWKNEGRR